MDLIVSHLAGLLRDPPLHPRILQADFTPASAATGFGIHATALTHRAEDPLTPWGLALELSPARPHYQGYSGSEPKGTQAPLWPASCLCRAWDWTWQKGDDLPKATQLVGGKVNIDLSRSWHWSLTQPLPPLSQRRDMCTVQWRQRACLRCLLVHISSVTLQELVSNRNSKERNMILKINR